MKKRPSAEEGVAADRATTPPRPRENKKKKKHREQPTIATLQEGLANVQLRQFFPVFSTALDGGNFRPK
jgi:hypothetical protein